MWMRSFWRSLNETTQPSSLRIMAKSDPLAAQGLISFLWLLWLMPPLEGELGVLPSLVYAYAATSDGLRLPTL